MDLNHNPLLPNGAQILLEKDYIDNDQSAKCILAYFELSAHPYVCWVMSIHDKSCYWGQYYNDIRDAYEYFTSRMKAIDTSKYDAIEVNCVKYLNDIEAYEICTLKDKPDLYSIYGHIPNNGVECIVDSYEEINAIAYAHWLAELNGLSFHNFISK